MFAGVVFACINDNMYLQIWVLKVTLNDKMNISYGFENYEFAQYINIHCSSQVFSENKWNFCVHTFIHFKPRGFYDTIVVQEIVTQKRRFTTMTPLWRATLYDSTPLPQVVAAQRPDSH